MACCNGDPRMKDLDHVENLARAYAKGEGIDYIGIYETNVPPIGKAYNFEPTAYGRKDFIKIIDVRDNPSPNILSGNVGRKPSAARKGKPAPIEEALPEPIGTGAEVSGDTGEILS